MSTLMNQLLADQQAIERRAQLPVYVPASKAEKIIANGEKLRREYRAANLYAETAMVFGAQVGYLHGMIVELCNKMANLEPRRDTNLLYAEVYCDELGCDVLAGYTYSPGEDSQTSGPPDRCHEGSPEELELCEVWVDGTDIMAALAERVAEKITDLALEYEREKRQDDREAAADYRPWGGA